MSYTWSLSRTSLLALVLLAVLITVVVLPAMVSADGGTFTNKAKEAIDKIGGASGLSNTPLETAIGNIINIFLGTLGIVAVCIVIYGGFLWMTASGNTEQVETAQTLLIQGLIGFVIIALAWSIATYVVSKIGTAV